MSRPPQAAQYLFILDVSYNALKSGYLDIFAEELLSEYKECYQLLIPSNATQKRPLRLRA